MHELLVSMFQDISISISTTYGITLMWRNFDDISHTGTPLGRLYWEECNF